MDRSQKLRVFFHFHFLINTNTPYPLLSPSVSHIWIECSVSVSAVSDGKIPNELSQDSTWIFLGGIIQEASCKLKLR